MLKIHIPEVIVRAPPQVCRLELPDRVDDLVDIVGRPWEDLLAGDELEDRDDDVEVLEAAYLVDRFCPVLDAACRDQGIKLGAQLVLEGDPQLLDRIGFSLCDAITSPE